MKRVTGLLVLAAIAAVVAVGRASAETKIRFSLDWIPGSVHAPFFIALYKGYYKAEGLDVSIERGKGSAELVRQLASGVYDMGYPDISVVTDFDSKKKCGQGLSGPADGISQIAFSAKCRCGHTFPRKSRLVPMTYGVFR